MAHIAAGVDCHRDTHVIACLDPLGRVLRTLSVGQTAADFARAIAEVVLREGDALGRHRGEGAHDELRLLYDQRDRLVRARSPTGNRLRHAAMRLGLSGLAQDPARPKAIAALRQRLDALAPAPGVDAALATEMRFALDPLTRLATQVRELEAAIRPPAERSRELAALTGVSHVAVAGLVGHAGDLRNLRSADAFAMRSGTAPLPCSSGRNQRMRINHRGGRPRNRLRYVMALVQIRFATHPGRLYSQRKLQGGKTPRAAIRALKRRLATVVYYRLLADTTALAAPPPPPAASPALQAA